MLVIPLGFILDYFVSRTGQHCLKGGCIFSGVQVGPGVAVVRRIVPVFLVGIGNRHILPFHTQNVANYPGRNVLSITAGPGSPAQSQVFITVKHGHQRAAVFQKSSQKVFVIGISVGKLNIVVDPYPVEQPQRFQSLSFPLGVVFIKSTVYKGLHRVGI